MGQIRRRAPVLSADDLRAMIEDVRERAVLPERDAEALAQAVALPGEGDGASRGRSGDMQEELRVERLEGERVRIGRWILRPGAGWELQHAPVMMPAARYAEALRGAGLVAG